MTTISQMTYNELEVAASLLVYTIWMVMGGTMLTTDVVLLKFFNILKSLGIRHGCQRYCLWVRSSVSENWTQLVT